MNEATFVDGFHDESRVAKMAYNDLGCTGLRVSRLSLGGGPFGGLYESVAENDAVAILEEAIRSGINYVDTAPWYGQGRSEAAIGQALKKIPRKSFHIGTKVGRYALDPARMFDFSAQRVATSVDQSLELLGLDCVDVIQVHDLEFAKNLNQIITETLPALYKVQQQGKARFIGITGYPLRTLKEVVEKSPVRIDVVLSYSRNTLIDEELKNYIPFFKEKGIGVIDAAPVAMGLLAPGGPPLWHPTDEEIKGSCQRAREFCQENNLDISTLAIKHSMRTGGIATHLVGVGEMKYLHQNFKAATEEVSPQELKYIEYLREKFFRPLANKNWEHTVPWNLKLT